MHWRRPLSCLLVLIPGLLALAGLTPAAGADPATVLPSLDQADPPSHDFANVVMPLLTRCGCNAASCHGAALGQGGFKLSLLGNDPEADFIAITRELSGRRIDRSDPAQSLILRKPTRQLAHRGGRVFEIDSHPHRVLVGWARGGFLRRELDVHVASLEARGPENGKLQIVAGYSDGSWRDVSKLALYSSNNDAVAAVSEGGEVKVLTAGETTIMVRFAGHVAAASVGRPHEGESPRAALGGLPQENFVDHHLGRALERVGLRASGQADPATFLRRAHVDLLGALPLPAEVRAYLARPDPQQLVSQLIARPEFDTYWAYRLGQIFATSSSRPGNSAHEFHDWLKGRVRQPWSETARTLLTASGSGTETTFYRLTADAREMTENAGRIFLGARWQCAQCHDHPFERFRQVDYFGLAAMFARVRTSTDGEIVHFHRGELILPPTGREALPTFPDGSPGEVDGDRRPRFAQWVLGQAQFRRAFANRVWALLMGRGLVHPVDDFRASNPSTHPELLDALAQLETIPELVAVIARSAAYARAGATPDNSFDRRFFSHFATRPLAAEVLVDAIARATGVPDVYPGRAAGTLAVDLGDFAVPSYTLDACGRGRANFEGSLRQTLHLLNGDVIQGKLHAVEALLVLGDEDLIDELYLRTLSRPATAGERQHWTQAITRGPRPEIAADLLWSLLNSRELSTCH